MSAPRKIETLDGLRGLAALAVAFDHFTLTVTNAQPGDLAHHLAAFAGSIGVGVFFLISGFVIPITLARATVGQFLVRRFLRLYPLFFACVVIRFFVNVDLGIAQWTLGYLKLFLLNVSMIGGLWVPIDKNIEPIVWTLAIEVKFYALCALILWLSRGRWPSLYRWFISATAVIGVCSFYMPPISSPWTVDLALALSALPFMMVGAFVSLHYFDHITRSEMKLGIVCALAAFLLAPARHFVSWDLGLPSWAIAAGIFAAALLFQDCLAFLAGKTCSFLGRVSYPLYAIHPSVLFMVNKYVTGPWWLKLIVYVPAILTVAYVLHRAIERPCIALAKRITARRKDVAEQPAPDAVVTPRTP